MLQTDRCGTVPRATAAEVVKAPADMHDIALQQLLLGFALLVPALVPYWSLGRFVALLVRLW